MNVVNDLIYIFLLELAKYTQLQQRFENFLNLINMMVFVSDRWVINSIHHHIQVFKVTRSARL